MTWIMISSTNLRKNQIDQGLEKVAFLQHVAAKSQFAVTNPASANGQARCHCYGDEAWI
jgi:hypothetical protein